MTPIADSTEGRLLSAVRDYLVADDWPVRTLPDVAGLEAGYQGDHGRWSVYVSTDEAAGFCVVYSVSPVQVPEARRATAAELVTRANYGLPVGNFELDLDDGEVRYKTSVAVGGADLPEDVIRTMVYINVMAMDRYLPAVMSVAAGSADPVAALAACNTEADEEDLPDNA